LNTLYTNEPEDVICFSTIAISYLISTNYHTQMVQTRERFKCHVIVVAVVNTHRYREQLIGRKAVWRKVDETWAEDSEVLASTGLASLADTLVNLSNEHVDPTGELTFDEAVK
jgi:hypothetical protein